jgi:ribosomal protein S18 acetylase RimI-like enzyme
VDVDIAPFDLGARLTEAQNLARDAMTAAGQPGGPLIGQYLKEVTDIPGLLPMGAHRDGELVGMLVGWPIANRWWWRHHIQPALAMTENLHWIEDAFELAEFHVRPALQGRGLGTKLLAEAENRVEQRRILLSTNAINNWSSREFYRRRGFHTLSAPVRWLGMDLRVYILGRELQRTAVPR